MTERTQPTDSDELAELFSELTGGEVLTTRQQEGASKAVLDTTDEEADSRTTGATVEPRADPLEDAIGDPGGE